MSPFQGVTTRNRQQYGPLRFYLLLLTIASGILLYHTYQSWRHPSPSWIPNRGITRETFPAPRAASPFPSPPPVPAVPVPDSPRQALAAQTVPETKPGEFIYRGLIGQFGVVENPSTQQQKLVEKGTFLAGASVESLDKQEMVLKSDNQEFHLPLRGGYTAGERDKFQPSPAVSPEVSAWKQDLEKLLSEHMVPLAARNRSLPEVLASLQTSVPGISLQVDPRVSLELPPEKLLLTLSTPPLPLGKVLDLISVYADLRHYPSGPGQVTFTLPRLADAPPPAEVAPQVPLSPPPNQAVARVKLEPAALENLLTTTTGTLLLNRSDIDVLASQLGKLLQLPVTIAPKELSCLAPEERRVSARWINLTVRQMLLRLQEDKGWTHTWEGNFLVLHCAPSKHRTAEEWNRILDKPISVAFKDAPIHIVIFQLERTIGTQILADQRIWNVNPTLTLKAEQVPARKIFEQISQYWKVSYSCSQEALLLTKD